MEMLFGIDGQIDGYPTYKAEEERSMCMDSLMLGLHW